MAEHTPTRGQIGIRFIYSLLFLAVLGVLQTIVVLLTFFQYAYLFIAVKHSEPARNFANRVITYKYKVMRYLTLTDNQRPFPFQEFPGELEPPVGEVRFD